MVIPFFMSAQTDSTFQIDFKVSKKGKKQAISQTVTQDDGTIIVTTFPEMDSTQMANWKQLNLSYQDSVQLYVSKEIERLEQQNSYIDDLKKQNNAALRKLRQEAVRSTRIREKLLRLK